MRHGELSSELALGIQELRRRIDSADIPPSQLDDTLNLATWNIREFGRRPRHEFAIHYIAEILNQFDLIALTEVRSDLSDLLAVMDILGPYFSQQKIRFVSLLLFQLLTIGLTIYLPQLMRRFIDAAQSDSGEARLLIIFGLVYIAISIIQQITGVLSRYLGETVSWKAILQKSLIRSVSTIIWDLHLH